MSGFAAIIRFDGTPVDMRMLTRMLDAIDYRGLDGRREWTDGQAAVGHLMLHTTGESLVEIQPLVNEAGTLVLVMDGWLANPDELRAELLGRGARLRSRCDAELVLHAVEAWGDACPRHIDGEYAFVVWDITRREVFCAKDHAGLRPLHYHGDAKRLLIASDLAGVLAAADFPQILNEGMLAEHIANIWCSRDETLWNGVKRLLPAHTLRSASSNLSLRRHWPANDVEKVCYRDDREYQAHYRDLLSDCVRRASRTHRPLACDVSGGHDSSAIFALAHQLEGQGALQAPSLRGYTYNYGPFADPEVDEVHYARAVARHLRTGLTEVQPFMPDPGWFVNRARIDRDMPVYPNAAMVVSLGQALTGDGCRVDLNGEGGDEFLTTSPFDYTEQIAAGEWRRLMNATRDDVAAFGVWQTLGLVYRFGLGPHVPKRFRELRRHFLKPSSGDHPGLTLLTPRLRDMLEQRRLAADSHAAPLNVSGKARRMLLTLENGFSSYAHDYSARNVAHLGYELRSPLYDRRLIEYLLAIPARQLRKGSRQKYVHLEAMRGFLPEVLLERRDKALGNLPFTVQLDRVRQIVLERALQCSMERIDSETLTELYESYSRSSMVQKPIYELWAVFGMLMVLDQSRNSNSLIGASHVD